MSEGSLDQIDVAATVRQSRRPRLASVTDRFAKRSLDIVASATLLVVGLPVIAICAIAIKLDSPGPVFYRARRAGRRGTEIEVLKFRKMHDGARGAALTGDVDPRFTRIGLFLARTKLDELPQLWNVLRGQMSLVGPRPEDPGFVALHEDAYRRILQVRPGITGLSQLAFAKEAQILDPKDRVNHYVDRILPQKVRIDLHYAQQRTFRSDMRILCWTILPVIMRVEVAVNRSTGDLTVRRRKRNSRSYDCQS